MAEPVLITVDASQAYEASEPEVLSLTTEGTLEQTEEGLRLSYEETELTGLRGTVTTFVVSRDSVILERSGTLKSKMVFVPGVSHKSLYSNDAGTFLITVRTDEIINNLDISGGNLRVRYIIEIEDTGIGTIEYSITVMKR